ncbi:MAG: GNAT family N-acetyltransferase [Cytophagales bacterium]|nr:GNAT family N-acetyltransferase [Cytophagales bacterium]
MKQNEIQIVPFSEETKEYIKVLNVEWLTKYFRVEESDELQLSNPLQEIIDKGGYIFYAKVGTEIVGTVTLVRVDDTTFELCKMAVREDFQGEGIGKKLMTFSLDLSKLLGFKNIVLYSNTRLEAALGLYKKFGFEEAPLEHSHYQRANIKMVKSLSKNK